MVDMDKKKIIQCLPILTLAGILVYTWYIIMTTDYFATLKHQVAMGLFLAALILYFIKFKYGIIFTGVFFILGTFNGIAIFPTTISSSYFVKIGDTEISTPTIQWKSFLLLVLFFVCTGRYLSNLYTEYKDKED
jgi:uncharacterized membrane protein